nr:FAD-dependent oxidoreductase [Paenibacillus bovis]
MGFFQDALAVFKKREITFMESYKETENVYSFLFEKENDFTWKAGQYCLFDITHKKIKNPTRPFSVASAPSEGVIRITTKIGDNPSEFKKALLDLEKGMKIRVSGSVGPFYLEGNSPALLVAGGMGITPFRAMLKQLEADGGRSGRKINLLYMDSQKPYLFKNELDEIANKSLITIKYLESRDDLQKDIDTFINDNKEDGNYYIAGPKSMVTSIYSYIGNKNIHKRNIKKDVSDGY